MQINILLFATLKDLVGKSQIILALPDDDTTLDDVRQTLCDHYPDIEANLNAALAAINQEFAFAHDRVKDGDEVAFFPPVSGGNVVRRVAADNPDQPEIFRLEEAPVDHDRLIAAITTLATGAVCLFSGVVRGTTDKPGHLDNVSQLHYEAYAPMALAKMRQVAAEIRERYPGVQGIAIIQRIGTLNVGENTVLIACSSGHRDEGCFEAARYGIDRLKEIVPVWKREISTDGAVWIEGEYTPTETDQRKGTR